jgi:hypothetical protein
LLIGFLGAQNEKDWQPLTFILSPCEGERGG